MASAFLTGIALIATCVYGIRSGGVDFAFEELYRYQLSKIDRRSDARIVFVGDSSLGNAIDAAHIERLTGRPSINLALTGAYGLGGSYNMLRRVFARSRPQLVVIMQTPDLLLREQVDDGFIHTALGMSDYSEVSLRNLVGVVATLDIPIGMVRHGVRNGVGQSTAIADDYIHQGPPLSTEVKRAAASNAHSLDSKGINQGHIRYIKKIGSLCEASKVRCVYAFGPWMEELCSESQMYLAEVRSIVHEAGIEVVSSTPQCMVQSDVGDAFDHVLPKMKLNYTDRYLEAIRSSGSWPN